MAGLQQTGGDRASKTIALHPRIYGAATRFDAGTRCVIHTHSTHCVALTLQPRRRDELLPPITPYFVMKVGHVPLIRLPPPGRAGASPSAWPQAIERYGARAARRSAP